MSELGELVRQARQRQGLTLTELARRTGMPVFQLAQLEAGRDVLGPAANEADDPDAAASRLLTMLAEERARIVADPTASGLLLALVDRLRVLGAW